MVLTHLVAFRFLGGATHIISTFGNHYSFPPLHAFSGFTAVTETLDSFSGHLSFPPFYAFTGFTDYIPTGLNQAPAVISGAGQRGIQNFATEEEEIALTAGAATLTGTGSVNGETITGTGSLAAGASTLTGIGLLSSPTVIAGTGNMQASPATLEGVGIVFPVVPVPQLLTVTLSDSAVTTITLSDSALT